MVCKMCHNISNNFLRNDSFNVIFPDKIKEMCIKLLSAEFTLQFVFLKQIPSQVEKCKFGILLFLKLIF